MVTRSTERLNLPAGGSTKIATNGPGIVGPKSTVGVFDTQLASVNPPPAQIQHAVDPIITAILGTGNKLLGTAIEQSKESAYLDGAAAVGQGLAEAQLESSPLTRAWATAGYRDTVGRLALADYEATTAADMKGLREQGPDAMTSYLRGKRQELMPTFNGMSGAARSTVFTQLLTSERAAIAAHTKAHSEFIVGTQVKTLQVGAAGMIDKMSMTQGDLDTHIPATDAAFAYVLGNIWQNPNLTPEARSKLVKEVAEDALAKGNVRLYEMLDTVAIPMEGMDEPSSILNMLPLKDQTDLAKAHRSSWMQNESSINQNWWRDFGNVQRNMLDPTAPQPELDQYKAMLNVGVERKAISRERALALELDFVKVTADKQKAADISRAAASGDYQTLAAYGTTLKQGAEAVYNSKIAGGMSVGEASLEMISLGADNGNGEMIKVGAINLKTSLAAAINTKSGAVDPSIADTIGRTTELVDRLVKGGNDAAKVHLLEALPEDQQVFMSRVLDFKGDKGLTTEAAIEQARALALEDKNTPKAVRQERLRENTKYLTEQLSNIGESQWGLSNAGNRVAAVFSTDSENLRKLRPYRKWFENEAATQVRTMETQNAVAQSFEAISLTNPSLPPEQVWSMALADVSKRSVPLEQGLLILPRGTNLHSVFGVSGTADPELIGKAINTTIKPVTDGGSLVFNVGTDGKLSWREFNTNGTEVRGDTLAATEVGKLVQNERKKEAEVAQREIGRGVTRTGSTGASVTYNGENTAGIPTNVALRVRDLLVEFEGVRDVPYQDGKYKSAGVGVNAANKHYYPPVGPDGKVTPADISISFIKASNGAMRAANSAAIKFNLRDERAVEFMSVMAYQGGEAAYEREDLNYPSMLRAINAKDTDKAVQLLHSTPAYRSAHQARKDWYEQEVRKLSK